MITSCYNALTNTAKLAEKSGGPRETEFRELKKKQRQLLLSY